jgi:tryptophan synthase beta chain
VRIVAVEPAACPSLTKGSYAYDFGDTAHLTPLVKMHTLGSTFVPEGIHAGGLRYHGMAPLVSPRVDLGHVEPARYHQLACFEAGVPSPAPRASCPPPKPTTPSPAAIDEALRCKARASPR